MYQKCPVCEGCGTVPPGFYHNDATAAGREPCKACGGRGIVGVPDFALPHRQQVTQYPIPNPGRSVQI